VLLVGGVAKFVLARTAWLPAVDFFGGLALGLALMLPLLGPLLAQRGLRETLDEIDFYKATPVPGRQIVLGQLAPHLAVVVGVQLVLMGLYLLSKLAVGKEFNGFDASALPAMLLMTPPVMLVVMCLPFAGVLWFPAWAGAFSARGAGFEVAGQRLLIGVSFLLLLAVTMAPAAGVGFVGFLLGKWLVGWKTGALLFGLGVAAVAGVEAGAAIHALGRRLDTFDSSLETR
jgi:hypothetical protein